MCSPPHSRIKLCWWPSCRVQSTHKTGRVSPICAHEEARGWHLVSSCFSETESLSLSLSPLDLELADLIRPAGHWAPGILLAYFPALGLKACATTPAFTAGSEVWTQRPHAHKANTSLFYKDWGVFYGDSTLMTWRHPSSWHPRINSMVGGVPMDAFRKTRTMSGGFSVCLIGFSVSGMTLSPNCSALCLRGNAYLSSSCFDENPLITKNIRGCLILVK